MAIKVIAQRREVKLGKNPGKKFVMRPDLYIPIQEKKVFAEASTHSGISAGEDHGGSTDHFLKFLYYTSFLTPHDPTSKFST